MTPLKLLTNLTLASYLNQKQKKIKQNVKLHIRFPFWKPAGTSGGGFFSIKYSKINYQFSSRIQQFRCAQ